VIEKCGKVFQELTKVKVIEKCGKVFQELTEVQEIKEKV